MSDKYVRPSKAAIEAEATRRALLQYHVENQEMALLEMNRRIIALEKIQKIESPETELIDKHLEEITARANEFEKIQAAKDAAEKRPAPLLKSRIVNQF